jgi:uracil-DNA glycosylase
LHSSNSESEVPAGVQIESSWKDLLEDEFRDPYFAEIKSFLVREKKAGKTIYPPGPVIFNAFNQIPVDQVRIVILGQDPYHNPGEAMGLCFSVPKGVRVPASLKNIFKEIERDLGTAPPDHGDLTAWTSQGVLLLNSILTVEDGQAGAHRNIGWQQFTDAVIRRLSQHRENLIFMLWGNFARNKKPLIDQIKHHVLEAVHPSPLAGGAFIGCGHFSKANELLKEQGLTPIDWTLS